MRCWRNKQENDQAVETNCKSRICSLTWCRIIVLKWLMETYETQESKIDHHRVSTPFFEIIETSQGRQKEGKIKDDSFCDSAKTISPISSPNSNRCLEFDFMNVTENLGYDGWCEQRITADWKPTESRRTPLILKVKGRYPSKRTFLVERSNSHWGAVQRSTTADRSGMSPMLLVLKP